MKTILSIILTILILTGTAFADIHFSVSTIFGLDLWDWTSPLAGIMGNFRLGNYIKPYVGVLYHDGQMSPPYAGPSEAVSVNFGADFLMPSKEWTVRPHAFAELAFITGVGNDADWDGSTFSFGGGVHIKIHPKIHPIGEGGLSVNIIEGGDGEEPALSVFARLGMEFFII